MITLDSYIIKIQLKWKRKLDETLAEFETKQGETLEKNPERTRSRKAKGT